MVSFNSLRIFFDKDFFGYSTPKVVKVKDRRVGILYRIFQLLIVIYIMYSMINNQLYLKKESPIGGAIRISLKAPDKFSEVPPAYCNNSVPCVYWGSNEIHYPSDGAGFAFFTTRANINRHFPPANCSFLKNYDKNCIVDPRQNPDNVLVQSMLNISYIADIEKYTIMVEHSIRGKVTTKTFRNGLLNGQLLSSDGKTVIKSWTNESRTLNDPRADGDIMTVGELLQAAGADLEGISGAPGADPGETFRSAGIVIVIIIDYQNNVLNPDEINYRYLPQVIGGSRYKTVESIYNVEDGSYVIKNRHGIRITFKQYGTIGEFDFITLLINLVAAITLFSISTFLVEFLMLYLLPEKNQYEEAIFERTEIQNSPKKFSLLSALSFSFIPFISSNKIQDQDQVQVQARDKVQDLVQAKIQD